MLCFYRDFSCWFCSIVSIGYIISAALFCVFLRDPVDPCSKDVNENKAPPIVPRPSDKAGEFNDAYTTYMMNTALNPKIFIF